MNSRSAFTLVELAIVLTVIGLLIGGIMAGRALLSNAGTSAVISDIEKYSSAVNGFFTKYEVLPGDMKNATDYWGTDSNGCPTSAVYTPRTDTCNGDGNGQLGNSNPELFHAWQHLANAGFVSGAFSGVTGADGATDASVGENVPPARVEGAGFAFAPYLGNGYAGDANRYAGDYGNATLVYGGEDGTNSLTNNVLTPPEAWNIDTKLDNGLPGSGRIMPFIGAGHTNCAASATAYNIDYDSAACALLVNITN